LFGAVDPLFFDVWIFAFGNGDHFRRNAIPGHASLERLLPPRNIHEPTNHRVSFFLNHFIFWWLRRR
jgi:hypothetical protein